MIESADIGSEMSGHPLVSVIVVSYNTRQLLAKCLHSVTRNLTWPEVEVIVVDNGSTDGSQDLVRSSFPQMRLIEAGDNLGYAAAVNRGLGAAEGDYLLLLNSDTEIWSDPIPDLRAFAFSNPDAGALGCRLVNPDGSLQPSAYGFPTALKELLKATGLKRLAPKTRLLRLLVGRLNSRLPQQTAGYWEHDEVRAVDYAKGACLMVPREAWERVGPMDESFFLYGEEMEWCYRMRAVGLRTYFVPVGQVMHHGGASSYQAWSPPAVHQYRSLFCFFRKHQPSSLRWWRPLTFAGMAGRLALGWPLLLVGREDTSKLLSAYWDILLLSLRGPAQARGGAGG